MTTSRMWLLVLALVVGACGGSQAPRDDRGNPRAQPSFHQTLGDSGIITDSTALTGRVVLDGKPVREFAIVLTRDAGFVGVYERPRVVRSNDGRFTLQADEKGRDVVIVGRGFSRHIILRSEIDELKMPDLGDIAVSRGDTIQGTVRDEKGIPLANAHVALITTPIKFSEDATNDWVQLSVGNLATVTDAHGSYLLEGVAANFRRGSNHPELSAWTVDRAALPVGMPYGNATVDFSVAPTGAIEVATNGPAESFVTAEPVRDPRTALRPRRPGFAGTGTTIFDKVPAGEYVVMLITPRLATKIVQQRVTVTAGSTTSLTLSAASASQPTTAPSP
jgi:hypothetical protein